MASYYLLLLLVIVPLFLLGTTLRRGDAHDIDRRLRRLEQKLDLILDALNLEHPDSAGLEAEIQTLVQAGKKIEAVRLLRRQTGATLNDACNRVEQIEHLLDRPSPKSTQW